MIATKSLKLFFTRYCAGNSQIKEIGLSIKQSVKLAK